MTTIKTAKLRVRGIFRLTPDRLSEYLAHLRTKRESAKHIAHVAGHLRDLQAHAGKLLVEMTRADLQAWGAELARRPLAESTVRKYHEAARGFYAWAADEGHIPSDPARRAFVAPKLPVRVPKHLEASELDALMAAVTGTPWQQARLRCAFALAAYAGLRADEALSLSWESISRDAGTLTVIGKGNKERRVVVTDALWSYLDTWQALSGATTGPVLVGPWGPGSRLTYDWLRRATKKAVERAQLGRRKFTFHALRHTYGTMLRRASIEVDVIQQQMGHSSISTTMIYVTTGVDEREAGRLRAALGRKA